MSYSLSLRSLRAFPTVYTLVGILLALSPNMYANDDDVAHAQSPSYPSSGTVLPTIQITLPQEGRQVPPGELTIQGISSDDENTNCRVYADVNDVTPMQNVTAAGDSKEINDFSEWSFTYTPEYQLIKHGENELTAKITCSDERNQNTDALLLMSTSSAPSTSSSPLSKWHTVNVTGVVGSTFITQPSPSAENTEGLIGKENESEESEEEDVGSNYVDVNSEEDSMDAEESSDDEQNDDDIDDNSEDDDNNAGDNTEDTIDSFFGGDPFFD